MKIDRRIAGLIIIIALISLWAPLVWAAGSPRDFIVAIDIGHTKKQGGALSAHGLDEYFYNKKVAALLLSELAKAGFKKSFIINESGDDISLIDRSIQADIRRADLFISIHHDSVQPEYLSTWCYKGKELCYCDLFKGFCILVNDNNSQAKNSLVWAGLLGAELLKQGFTPTLHHAEPIKGENRKLIDEEKGIYEYNKLVVLKNAKMPAVLLECGVIKNRQEEDAINGDYRSKLVKAIVAAVTQYFGSSRSKLR